MMSELSQIMKVKQVLEELLKRKNPVKGIKMMLIGEVWLATLILFSGQGGGHG